MEGKKEPRISSTSAALLVGTAVVFDVVSAVPAIGQAIAAVGSAVVFGIWFVILGVPLVSPKKLLTWSLAYLVWVPISAVVAVRTGEPSLDVLLAVGITALLPSVPFVALLAGGCIWLFLPLLALSWLLRVSIKHTEFSSSMPNSPASRIHD